MVSVTLPVVSLSNGTLAVSIVIGVPIGGEAGDRIRKCPPVMSSNSLVVVY